MNEILTRLSEIEEKAETILCDASAQKEGLSAQLEQEMKKLDEMYDQMERESMRQLEEMLVADKQRKLSEMREKNETAEKAFEMRFEREKEQFVEQILQRVIQ